MPLTEKTRKALEEQSIVRISGTAIHLSSGKAIYLDEDEIDSLNDHYDPEIEEEEKPLLSMLRDILQP